MTFHLATARSAACLSVQRLLAHDGHGQAANDNPGAEEFDDRMLHAALRHFAEHGLSAARAARGHAEHAFFAGDRKGYDWWLGICRTLDRQLASELAQRFDQRLETSGNEPPGKRPYR